MGDNANNGKSNGQSDVQSNLPATSAADNGIPAGLAPLTATLATKEATEQSGKETLSVAKTLRGRHILMTGVTGFLGKVAASMLLHRHPDIGHLYLVVRPSSGQSAQERFQHEVALSPVFKPLREVYTSGFDDFLKEKVTILAGDIAKPGWGLPEETLAPLREKLDLVLNSAGLTSFTPALEQSININTRGPLMALEFVRSCKKAAMAHISTTYVTGTRAGTVSEDESPYGFYPRKDELRITFDPEQELIDCGDAMDALRKQADDQKRRALLTRLTRDTLENQNRNPNDPAAFEEQFKRERSKWIRDALREEGKRRAEHWGWTNTYTYSKSLGEQLLTRAQQKMRAEGKEPTALAIIRPSVIESSISYPEPGWNQGANTSAPISYLISQGIRFVPASEQAKLDVVPVDMVCNGILLICAGLIARKNKPVYQLGTSERNPVKVTRLIELCTLWTRRHYARKVSAPRWRKFLANTLEAVPVSAERYEKISAPAFRRGAVGVQRAISSFGKTGIAPVDQLLKGIRRGARKVEKQARIIEMILGVFLPFTHDNLFTFEANSIKALEDMLPPEEQSWGFNPETLCWRDYWINIHLPGLARHVYPDFEKRLRENRREVHTPKDLLEVFRSSAQNHADKVALQQMTPDGTRRYTYAELQTRADWIAASLRSRGLHSGARVLLLSENRPEWGMTYFGVLEAGAAAVPVDSELSMPEIINLARSCRAGAFVVSEKVRTRLVKAGLEEALERLEKNEDGLKVQVLGFEDLLVEPGAGIAPNNDVTALVPVDRSEDVASLIYTSGTTGQPKGVMLAHRNFTALLTSINQVFDINDRDSFLSVLPLHHTFEFTCGFLMPLSRGATITYMDELNGESLNRAFTNNRITAMIGVPALWQLLHRRITGKVAERGPAARTIFDTLVSLNRLTRDRFKVNLGQLFFGAVHKGLGGNIRYLISGGASLPAPIMETFHGLGFELLEGYGLTEAAPVLTCGRPGGSVRVGSVGKALPGVQVTIQNPDPAGVGEIVAKGGNVMLGYYNNAEATEAVIDEDGWLHTGDLGRIDKRGRLFIAGRQKEIIVASNGENVYPDELEEIYEHADLIEELSVVGLPDGQGSERVACMVRPIVPEDGGEDRAALEADIRKHFDLTAARLPYHQRVKVLRFTYEELPRTATRKIKRKAVVGLLEAAGTEKNDATTATTGNAPEIWGQWTWLRDASANLAGVEGDTISRHTALIDDLGFDSLAFTELSGTIESQTGKKLSTDELIAAGSLQGIMSKLERTSARIDNDEESSSATPGFSHLPSAMRPQEARRPVQQDTTLGDLAEIPEPMRKSLKQALGEAQKMVYKDLFDMRIYGKAHIPFQTHALVAANHCSHLDMGLVKTALSDWAPDLRTLAASDYFFDTKAKRTYFGQLTNLIPVQRSGSLEESMSEVSNMVQQGQPLLLFPEGTRSTTGDIAEFRPGLGYLVMNNKVGVLPVYLGGTYRALPKGAVLPKNRRLRVHIGEMIPYEFFEERTRGMSSRQAYLEVARLVREAILALKAGRRFMDQGENNKAKEQDDQIAGLFRTLDQKFQENQVDEPVSFYFSLGKSDSGKWTLLVSPDKCSSHPGKPTHGRADCVVKTSPEMFRKMVNESYVPSMDEFMNGHIKTNDVGLLMAFQNIFAL